MAATEPPTQRNGSSLAQQEAGQSGGGASLRFRTFAPGEDHAAAEDAIAALSQALVREGVVLYFTKGNTQAAALFWQELLRARFRCSPAAQQIFCLSDFSTAAIVHRYPQERSTRWGLVKKGAVLKFASAVPLGKWRAINECAADLERQKQAFLQSHGEFLYLEVIATAPALQRRGLGSMLLHHICHLADEQGKYLYAEASSEAVRRWYRQHGFGDVMTYTLRPHAPKLLIMARAPRAQQPDPAPAAAAAAGAGGQWRGQGWGAAAGVAGAGQPQPASPLYPSVRSKGPKAQPEQ